MPGFGGCMSGGVSRDQTQYKRLDGDRVMEAPQARDSSLSAKPASGWLPRVEHPERAAIDKHQSRVRGDATGELGQVARSVKELFPGFKFSSALMEAYSAAVPDGKSDLDLGELCKHLVYINNNLRVYDIAFERSWFSGSLGIEFRSLTGRDAVVKEITDKARELLKKMRAEQPAVDELEEGDVLIGLNQIDLDGEFMEKMNAVKGARKKVTLTFAKLAMTETMLEKVSEEEMTEVRDRSFCFFLLRRS
jgi:hypothetical protein